MREAVAPLRPPEHLAAQRRGEGRPKGLHVLGTMAWHPALARAFHTFNAHLLYDSTLSARQRELVVLRVAALRRCDYEWRQHVVLARDAGLTDEEVDRIAQGPGAPGWASLERAMLSAVDELVRDATIAEATWDVLDEGLGREQLMDLVFTVGAYDLLAMALRSFRVQPDDDLPAG